MVHFEPADDTAKKTTLAPVTYLPGVFPGDGPVRTATPVRTPRATPGWHVESGEASAIEASEVGADSFDADSVDADLDVADSVQTNAAGTGSAFDAAAGDGDADDSAVEEEIDPAEERERAEHLLMRRLRSRSLSVKEASAVLAATDIDAGEVEEIIERFRELHYIDEDRLADQIVHSHHERKGLGRSGVETEMRRRGLDPILILTKLEELPDDEAERAGELAIKRIRQLDRLDDQTIDRRLTGFLLRKGYSSAAVRAAVKAAMASRSGGDKASGVRFR
ncbi:hypothetical protein GCM10022381_35440 [Leifsonia kafniensis]|uniref:Regulatory protein RecX n=1 Tax=Leifsonia kafniensis TaxID=475957 RepID=A0ABP7L0R3_9MICO